MQTILDILRKAGGWHPGLCLKIDNPPYLELVIEAMDGQHQGNLMRHLRPDNPDECLVGIS
jgi:hypothetical protein